MGAAAALSVLAGMSVQAATLYECTERSPRDPGKAILAIALVDGSGRVFGMDAWSFDTDDPNGLWPAEIKRNDAEMLDLRWSTDRQRSTQGTYSSLRITLRIRKSDLLLPPGSA